MFQCPVTQRNMQSNTQKRWWYSDDKHNESDKVHKSRKAFGKKSEKTRKYKFMVMVNFDLNPYEKVAVTGGCDELGNWDNDLALLLDQENGELWENHKAHCCEAIFLAVSRLCYFYRVPKTIFSRDSRHVKQPYPC